MNTALSSLIESAEQGDRAAADPLFTALYDELHRMARRELSKRAAGMTLGATTLLHEAYLDISDREGVAFPDRNRFMGYAARVMRGLIIDYARSRQAQKRGGQFEITSLSTDIAEAARRRRRLDPPERAPSTTSKPPTPPAGAGRRPEVLLRVLVRGDRGDDRRCRSARCSATGRRRGSTCTRCSETTSRWPDVGF